MKRVSLVVTLALAAGLSAQAASAQTLKTVKDRGMLSCGVSQGLPGFSTPDDKGNWTGLDVDICRAIAAAIFNDATKIKFVPLSAKDRFTALQSGEIDVLSRNTTWTLSRDTSLGANFTGVTYYDGQGFLVKKSLKVNSALELNSASVCVQTGTTTEQNLADYFKGNNMKYEVIAFGTADETVKAYESGRCDVFTSDVSQLYAERLKLANPADHVVLPEVISKEPLGPMVRHGDDQWFDVVKWTLFAMVGAEELGVTQKNVDEMAKSDKPELKRAVRHRRQSRRTARPDQGLAVADREGGRQLRRVLRAQRRLRLQARHRPRPQQPLEQGRYPVRAADPLIAGGGAAAMAIEPRQPPSQLLPKLQRALGGRAGWSGFVLQLLFVAALAWICYEIVANARANLQAQRITAGFGFLANTAGFDVSQNLIPYSGSDTYTRVFLVGLLNTLLVSVIGIFFATLIGFIVALGRLSPNWLLSRISGGYVELIRNLPVLFQILFWYLAVLAALPNPRQSISIFDSFFLSNRGLVIPKPIGTPGFEPFVVALLVAIVAAIALWRYSRRQLFQSGKVIKVWPYALGLVIGLPLLSALIFGAPVTFEIPALKGFNFAGGSRVIPEFVALTLALSTYTAAFIAEIVRAGILSVHKGQMEAGSSLGLQRGSVLRLIVIPQAMRVILPPLTNQYLNLTKNSSLAVAIGYPDLVSVFAGTTLSQTGQAIEIIGITMGVYLLISLVTSAIMSFYGWRISRSMSG